jgi:hypothetical protein
VELGSQVRAWAVRGTALLAIAAGAWLSMGTPRLTLMNNGLRVVYPWPAAAGAVLAAVGAAALALAVRLLWIRVVAALLAVGSLWVGLHLLRYRVEADGQGIRARGLLGERRLAWPTLTRVETPPGLVVVIAGEDFLELDVTDYRPEDRATLARAIARRVQESSRP